MKIAIFSETNWAFGRIHTEMIRCMPEHDFEYFDWTLVSAGQDLASRYADFDIIVGNTGILYGAPFQGSCIPLAYAARCLAISHCPVLDHEHYKETVLTTLGPTYMGVSPECCASLSSVLRKAVPVTPFGINPVDFPPHDPPPTLLVAGLTASVKYKNVHVASEICNASGLSLKAITRNDAQVFTQHSKLYDGIDIFLCASSLDAGPLGNFEAAALGIPVLSTAVGNWSYVKSALCFKTPTDAAQIISFWRGNPEARIRYATTVRDEVHALWTNDQLMRSFLVPTLEAFGRSIDLLDIGASLEGSSKSIHVDPLANPANHRGFIEYAAVVETPLDPVLFYTEQRVPSWLPGCARVGSVHPSCDNVKTLCKPIRIVTLASLVRTHRLRYIDCLNLVVEGYDVYLLKALNEQRRQGLLVRTIRLLWNELANVHERALCKLELQDFDITIGGHWLEATLKGSVAMKPIKETNE